MSIEIKDFSGNVLWNDDNASSIKEALENAIE